MGGPGHRLHGPTRSGDGELQHVLLLPPEQSLARVVPTCDDHLQPWVSVPQLSVLDGHMGQLPSVCHLRGGRRSAHGLLEAKRVYEADDDFSRRQERSVGHIEGSYRRGHIEKVI
jgi:hypothetical protein